MANESTKSMKSQISNRPKNQLDLLIGSPSSTYSVSSTESEQFGVDFNILKPTVGPPSPQLPLDVLQTIESLNSDINFTTPKPAQKKSVFFGIL